MSKVYFAIYLDGTHLGNCVANRAAAKQWLSVHVLSAHNSGEWHRVKQTWYYHTSIGRVYKFMKFSSAVEPDYG